MSVDGFPPDLQETYASTRRLGAGGMGVVFHAQEIALDRPVAVKLLLGSAGGQDEEAARIRFLEEARVMARVVHENVIEVYSVGTCKAGPYIVMEYVEGEALHEVRRSLDLLRVFLSVAEGLDAVHAEGILHRDIKPPNILIRSDDRPVLLDFGLAKGADRETMTRTGQVLGTNGFLAPELLIGRPATRASDWFAWGVSFYVMAEGRLPYTTADLLELVQGKVVSPAAFRKTPEGHPIRSVLLAALSPDPGRRPSHAGAIRAVLQASTASSVGGAPAPIPTQVIESNALKSFVEKASREGAGSGALARTSTGNSGIFSSAVVPSAAKGWWHRTRGRRRFVKLYLPMVLAWSVAGTLAWGAWTLVSGRAGRDVDSEVRIRIEADRRQARERYSSQIAAALAALERTKEKLRAAALLEGALGFRNSGLRYPDWLIPEWREQEREYLEQGMALLRTLVEAKKSGVLEPELAPSGSVRVLMATVRQVTEHLSLSASRSRSQRQRLQVVLAVGVLGNRGRAGDELSKAIERRQRFIESRFVELENVAMDARLESGATPLAVELHGVLLGAFGSGFSQWITGRKSPPYERARERLEVALADLEERESSPVSPEMSLAYKEARIALLAGAVDAKFETRRLRPEGLIAEYVEAVVTHRGTTVEEAAERVVRSMKLFMRLLVDGEGRLSEPSSATLRGLGRLVEFVSSWLKRANQEALTASAKELCPLQRDLKAKRITPPEGLDQILKDLCALAVQF